VRRTVILLVVGFLVLTGAGYLLASSSSEPLAPLSRRDDPLASVVLTTGAPLSASAATDPASPRDPRRPAESLVSRLRLLLAGSSVPADSLGGDELILAHLDRLQDLIAEAQDVIRSRRPDGVIVRLPVAVPALWAEFDSGDQILCVGPSSGVEFYTLSTGPCRIDPATVRFYRELLDAVTPEEFLALLGTP
jgi:hypothetical protein